MNILVPGGCGYIGALLVPQLLYEGHKVTVYDTMLFGRGYLPDNETLKVIGSGDVRIASGLDDACKGQQAVICLAGITSETMCRKYATVARTVNVTGMMNVALSAKVAGVERFIFASSVTVYGNSDEAAIETASLRPTTIYGECKADAEIQVRQYFPEAVIVRSASVCGYSPRQRFDLTVNKMIHDGLMKGTITVNGGEQKRSHIHIKDICDFYKLLLSASKEGVSGQVFNAVDCNESVMDTAWKIVRASFEMGRDVKIIKGDLTDDRSYSVDGWKAFDRLGFSPRRSIEDAVFDLTTRFTSGYWKDCLTNPAYQNHADVIA